jgi:DNA-binding response OmpR family regulator
MLLVDDDDDFRFAFAESLRSDGWRVIVAASGKAALSILEQFAKRRQPNPDLLVLDLMMPAVNGIELLQRLRRNVRWSEVPVLIVTGINDTMLPVRLNLPVAFKTDVESLFSLVRQWLSRSKALGREA